MVDRTEQSNDPASLDDDTPPWERRRAEPSPQEEVGTSPLAKELEDSGVFRELGARQERERTAAQKEAVEQSQGYSFESLRKATATRLGQMPPETMGPGTGVAGGVLSHLKNYLSPDKQGFLGPEVGMLSPEEREAAGKAELETAEVQAPRWRGVAESLPKDWSEAAYKDRVQAEVDKLAPGEAIPVQAFETSPIGWLKRFAYGSVDSYATRQEKRLGAAKAMARGEIDLPDKAWWRDKVETGGRTVGQFAVANLIQYAGITAGYFTQLQKLGVGPTESEGGFAPMDPWDNSIVKFGKEVEKLAEANFPGDKARQYEFGNAAVQGVASTLVFGGQASVVQALLNTGAKGVLATIALSGAASQVPDEFERVTDALKNGNATEQDRIINFLANTALGATEALPFAPTFAGRGALGTRAAVKRGLEQGIEQTVQEGTQQYGQNITRATYDPTQDPYEGVLESMGVAAGTGFGFGAAYSRAKGMAEIGEGLEKAKTLGLTREAKVRTGGVRSDVEPGAAPAQGRETQPAAPVFDQPEFFPGTEAVHQAEAEAPAAAAQEAEPMGMAAMVRKSVLGRGLSEIKPVGGAEAVDRVAGQEAAAPSIAVGDEVQWTSAGADQFTEPRKVTWLSPDGQWATVEGSNTGVPAAELTKAAPAWQRELAKELAAIAAPLTDEQRTALERDVDQNLAGYGADIEAVYNEQGVAWDLGDEDVKSVAFHMAQGLAAEEALERYAVERFEAERAGREEAHAESAAGPTGGREGRGQAGTEPGGGTSTAAAPAGQAAGLPGGARANGPAVAGVGAGGARPGAGGRAQPAGQSQRAAQQERQPGPAEREHERALRQRFRSLLAGKSPKSSWGRMLNVDEAKLGTLIDEAVEAGLLQRYGAPDLVKAIRTAPSPEVASELNTHTRALDEGAPTPILSPEADAHLKASVPNVRRTKLVRVAPRESRTRPLAETLAIPPDVRIASAVRIREAETGKPVSDTVRNWAEAIEAARGTPAFEREMAALTEAASGRSQAGRAGRLSKAEVLELARLVGRRPTAKTTKDAALASIQKRHDDLARYAEGVEMLSQGMPLFSFASRIGGLTERIADRIKAKYKELGFPGEVVVPTDYTHVAVIDAALHAYDMKYAAKGRQLQSIPRADRDALLALTSRNPREVYEALEHFGFRDARLIAAVHAFEANAPANQNRRFDVIEGGGQPLFSFASPRSQRSLEEREAAARKVMESPEWKAAAEKPMPARDTSKQKGYLSPEWKAARQYVGPDGKTIAGFDAAVKHLAAQAEAEVPGGFATKARKATIVIGYPGAGKSTIAEAIRDQFGAVHVTADDAKLIIPEYDGGKNSGGVHMESTDLAEAVVQRLASEGGKNFIIETLGTTKVLDKRAKEMRDAGYKVALIHADVPRALAMERAVARKERDGRAVPLEIYDQLKAGEVYDKAKATGAVDDTAKAVWDEGTQAFKVAEASPGLEAVRADIERAREPSGLAGEGGAGRNEAVPARQGGPHGPEAFDRNGRLKGTGDQTLFSFADRPYTEAFKQALPEWAPRLEAELRKMLPKDVAVRMVDRLLLSGIPTEALTRPPQVPGDKWLIEIALADKGFMSALQQGAHETTHVLRERGLWSDKEWQLLLQRAKKLGMEDRLAAMEGEKDGRPVSLLDLYKQQYREALEERGLKGRALDARVAELVGQEFVARMVEDFVAGKASYGTAIDRLLERIAKFFEAVRNALHGLGFRTADDVLEKAFGENVRQPQWGERIEPTFGESPEMAAISQFPERGWASPIKVWEEAIARHFKLERGRGNLLVRMRMPEAKAFFDAATIAMAAADPSVQNLANVLINTAASVGLSKNHVEDIINIHRKLVDAQKREGTGPEMAAFKSSNEGGLARAMEGARVADDELVTLLEETIARGPQSDESDRVARFLGALTGEGGGATRGRPEEGAAVAGGPRIGRAKLPVEGRLRSRAIDRYLGDTFARDRVEARAKAQGFITDGFHGTRKSGAFEAPDAFRQNQDFGFHVALGAPGAANSRLGYPGTFFSQLAIRLAPPPVRRRLMDMGYPGSMLPVRIRAAKPIRLPDMGEWADPERWLTTLGPKAKGEPKAIYEWINGWVEKQGPGFWGRQDAVVDTHEFSRAVAAELERRGYDAVIYKNRVEAAGIAEEVGFVKNDSLFVWNPTQVRSAHDVFDERAKNDTGLMASAKYVEQDLREHLNRALITEGLSGIPLFSFKSSNEGKGNEGQIEPSFRRDDIGPGYDPRAQGLGASPRSLTAIIADLKRALQMPVTQGLGGVTVRNPETGYSRRLSPQANVAGQYQTPGGVARIRLSTDIDAIAHEGGHHLEHVIGEPLRDLITTHAEELSPYAGQVASVTSEEGEGWLSEGFAEFFRDYVLAPEKAQVGAPGFYHAFNELLDSERPDILDGLDRVQLTTLSKDYQDYQKATAVERLVADVATLRPPTAWDKIKAFFKTDNQAEVVDQWLSSASFNLADMTNPSLKLKQSLMRQLDASGARDVDGRPISLKITEDPQYHQRMLPQSFKVGHQLIVNGITSYGALEADGPTLHGAMVEFLGGRSRFDWADTKVATFQGYLEAQRAIVEWARNLQDQEITRQVTDYYAGSLEIAAIIAEGPREGGRRPYRKSFQEYWHAIEMIERGNPRARNASVMARDWQHRLLTLEWQAGLWSDEEFTNLTRHRAYYVPNQRDFSDVPAVLQGIQAAPAAQKSFQKAKPFIGSDRNIIGALETMAMRAYTTAEAIQRNDVARAFATLSDRVPGHAKIVERIETEETLPADERTFAKLTRYAVGMGMDPQDAAVLVREMEAHLSDAEVQLIYNPQHLGPKRGIIMPFWESGERKLIRFNDALNGSRLLQAMNELGRAQSGILVRVVSFPAEVLRAGVVMHPAYIMANIIGDMQNTLALTGAPPVYSHLRGAWHELSSYPNVRAVLKKMGITPSDVAEMQDRVGLIAGGQVTADIQHARGRRQGVDLTALRNKGYQVFDIRAVAGLGTAVAGGAVGAAVGAGAGAVLAVPGAIVGGVLGYRAAGLPGAATGAVTGAATTGAIVGATLGVSVGAMMARMLFGQNSMAAFAKFSELSETFGRRGVAEWATKRAKAFDPSMSDIDAIREGVFTANDTLPFDRRGFQMSAVLRAVSFFNGNIQGVGKVHRQAWMIEGERGRVITIPAVQGGLLGAAGTVFGGAMLGMPAGPIGAAIGAGAGAMAGWSLYGKADMEKLKVYLRYALTRTAGAEQAMKESMSQRDQKVLRDGMRVWIWLSLIGVAGAALAMLYKDDPEYDDVRTTDDQTKYNHWVFKAGGIWYRLKRFEFGYPAIATEAAFDLIYKGDPRVWEKLRDGFLASHTPPVIPQALNLQAALRTGVDPRTGRPIVPDYASGLSAVRQRGPYTSAFANEWATALHAVGIEVSPYKIDYALQTELAYWGREIKTDSDYFTGKDNRAPKLTDYPIVGTMVNRFTLDPSRRSESVREYWRLAGKGQGPYATAAKDYDDVLKSGSEDSVKAFLAGLKPEERLYAVLDKHFKPAEKEAHPLNRARAIFTIDQAMKREMAMDRLVNTQPGQKGEIIPLSPQKRVELDDILGRLSAIEVWNALHDIGRPGWEKREIRNPQPVLDELKGSSEPVFDELMQRRRKAKVGDYADDQEKWLEIKDRVEQLIQDEDMLGTKWEKTVKKRRSPTPNLSKTPNFRQPVPDERLPSMR
jgi:predicted ABC-type ATPase